jgi:hypothetical protein
MEFELVEAVPFDVDVMADVLQWKSKRFIVEAHDAKHHL